MEKTLSMQVLERKMATLAVVWKDVANEEMSNRLFDMAHTYIINGLFDEGIYVLRKALVATPDRPGIHNDLANVLMSVERESEAIESYQAALKLCPTHTAALQNLAIIRFGQKHFNEAEQLCRKAIESSTGECGVAKKILAKIEHSQGDIAVLLQSDFTAPLQWSDVDSPNSKSKSVNSKQNSLTQGQQDNQYICESIRQLRDDLKRNPNNAEVIGQLYTQLQICCDWKDYDGRMKKLSALIDDQLSKNLDPPVNSFSAANFFPLSLREPLAIASYFSERSVKEATDSPIQHRLIGKQLRIGYFLTGPSKFPVISKQFNSDRCEVFYYWYYEDPTKRVADVDDSTDHLINLSRFGKDTKAAANRIASDGIQILINLIDFETDCTSAIFAHRPAPIQAVYRTRLGSTGASYVDYFITDKVASPLQYAYGYSEKLAYMPNGMFICNQPEFLIKPQNNLMEKVKLRKRSHLPESAIVFGVKSESFMIDPKTFDCWCEILREVHGSVIWIFVPYLAETQSNLKKEAKKRKINPHRLIFIDETLAGAKDSLPIDQMIDIFLDTPMRNADHLMYLMCRGIPIVALPRESFQSRRTASMLTSISCGELIAKSTWEYVQIAVNLANKYDLLKEMRAKMSEILPDSNLLRIDQHMSDLEDLYEKMWKWRELGEKPEHIV